MQPRQECIRCGASLESAPDPTTGLCADCHTEKYGDVHKNETRGTKPTTIQEEKSK